MKIAYLASQQTMVGPNARTVDAIEHAQMMDVLNPVFTANRSEIHDLAWDHDINWSGYDAALIGSTWDYCDRHAEYIQVLQNIGQQIPLFNNLTTVKWNSDKRYLADLTAQGVHTIPTLWHSDISANPDWSVAMNDLESQKLVVKRQVGAGAEGQFLFRAGDTAPELTHPVMIQPFMKSIAEEGEYSFIFIDGDLSHALIKKAKRGDYRIQAAYGGMESKVTASAEDIKTARATLEPLEEMPMYARVDMVRDDDQKLALMELELIEPFLYPLQSNDLGQRLYSALQKRLA